MNYGAAICRINIEKEDCHQPHSAFYGVKKRVPPGERQCNDSVYFHLITDRAALARFPNQTLTGPEGNRIIISIKYFCTLSKSNNPEMISK